MSSPERVFLSPDGQTRVIVSPGLNGDGAQMRYLDATGTELGLEGSSRPYDKQCQWYPSFGWTEQANDATG